MYNFLGFILNSSVILSFENFFEKIKDTFFTLDLGEYENLNIGSQDSSFISIIIFGVFVGIIIISLVSIFNKRTLGDFVRKIISEDCIDAKSAKTLLELGYMKNAGVRGSLKSGVTLKRVVRCAEEEEYYKQFGIEPRPVKVYEEIIHGDKPKAVEEEMVEEKKEEIPADKTNKVNHKLNIPPYRIDLNNDHFYIAKNDTYMADVKFEAKGTNWGTFGFLVVISLVAVVLLFKFLPGILQMADDIMGSVKPDNNILG